MLQYGAGLGFYLQNFETMAQWAGRRASSVYALDWLGMGRSARPPFTIQSKRTDIPARVHEAEAFFIDSLEDWRKIMGLEKMTLIGHSIGGYLSVAYALKYPERVNRLVLLSPAGVPQGPDTTNPEREFDDEEEPSGDTHAPSAQATHAEVEKLRSAQKQETPKQAQKRTESRGRRIFSYLWEEGYSPFALARASSFWAPMLIGKYSSRRFSGLTEEETRNIHDYILNITLAKGSGEYCICKFCLHHSLPPSLKPQFQHIYLPQAHMPVYPSLTALMPSRYRSPLFMVTRIGWTPKAVKPPLRNSVKQEMVKGGCTSLGTRVIMFISITLEL